MSAALVLGLLSAAAGASGDLTGSGFSATARISLHATAEPWCALEIAGVTMDGDRVLVVLSSVCNTDSALLIEGDPLVLGGRRFSVVYGAETGTSDFGRVSFDRGPEVERAVTLQVRVEGMSLAQRVAFYQSLRISLSPM